jgi:hypothetical protein
VNISFVRYKVDWCPNNVYGFVNPFGVESGVETLKMSPTCLFVLYMVDIDGEVGHNYLVVSILVLEGHDYGCLGHFWGEIIAK